jgi:hypothetical protein
MAKSLKYKNFHIMFSHNKNKHVLACIFGFNNQFIKVMRTRPIFQKISKNYFVFF